MLKKYYNLTKPGIIYGNLINATAGFLLASRYHVDPWLLLAVWVGTSLVVASGCVFNNYIDRDIDKKMSRTKQRALVTQAIPVRNALVFATILGILGFAVLAFYTNWLVVLIGVVGFVDYVAIYGYAKRHSVHSTLVGSISGATPIIAGYCAVTGRIDAAAVIIFLMLAAWQMPHFYGIAMYRYDDYKRAKLPVMPVSRGMLPTKLQTLIYIGIFTALATLLTAYHYTGYIYLVVMLATGLAWFIRGIRLFNVEDKIWGRKMFLFSLIVVMVMAVMLSVGARLP
jgi:protoheme IX farnesyltransferase